MKRFPVQAAQGTAQGPLVVAVAALLLASVTAALVIDDDTSSSVRVGGTANPAAGAVAPESVTGTGANAQSLAPAPGSDPVSQTRSGARTGTATAKTAAGNTAGSAGSAVGTVGGATDRGVLADRIKVGFTIIDIATVGRLGGSAAIDTQQQQAAMQAYVDDINSRGIHGRKLEPFYKVYDILKADEARAACLELADDKKVFTAFTGFSYPEPILCFVKEKQVPIYNSLTLTNDFLFAEAQGRLTTLYARSQRMMEVFAGELHALGALTGKKIGILSDDSGDPNAVVAKDLERAVLRKGHKVVYRGQMPASLDGTASNVPIQVSNMQREGVELVLMLTATTVRGTQFVQQAESQRATWKYAVPDWGSNYLDSGAENMPPSFDGTILVTATRGGEGRDPNRPEHPQAVQCRKVYEANSGRKLAPRTSNEYGLTMNICDMTRYFEQAARAAGPNLTKASLSAGYQSLGNVSSASLGDGFFRAGKFDMNEMVRHSRWAFACRCFVPVDEFHAGRT